MPEQILFLTGKLAERQLNQVLNGMAAEEFDWRVQQLGLKVAALMTADMIKRRHQCGHLFQPGKRSGLSSSFYRRGPRTGECLCSGDFRWRPATTGGV